LRLNGNGLRSTAQLASVGIEGMAGKEKLHFAHLISRQWTLRE